MYENVDWKSGPNGKLWHKKCKAKLAGWRKLNQAKRRKEKSERNIPADGKTESTIQHSDDERPATRTKIGVISDAKLCLFCMKTTDEKNAHWYGKSHQLVDRRAWIKIAAGIAFVKDPLKRERLQILIDSTPDCIAAHLTYLSWKVLQITYEANQ